MSRGDVDIRLASQGLHVRAPSRFWELDITGCEDAGNTIKLAGLGVQWRN